MEVNDSKKVAWNASQGIISEISSRRTMANTFFINGNLKKAFITLISIKQSVLQSFEKHERKKLTDVEEKFNKIKSALSNSLSLSFNKKDKDMFSLANRITNKLYSEYNELLMDLLDKKGYLIGEQSDSSRMRF
jgi:hypothetical protein